MNAPAFIPVDTAERSFAQIIAELSADHERFVSAIDGFDQRFNAWSGQLDQTNPHAAREMTAALAELER